MAAATGASVVSIDSDPETVAALWRSAAARGVDILPLLVDFARPTPATGWRCAEHASFLERAEGFFDCVLLLAVTHHLMVTDQIPLDQIFDVVATLTTRFAVVEYIGPRIRCSAGWRGDATLYISGTAVRFLKTRRGARLTLRDLRDTVVRPRDLSAPQEILICGKKSGSRSRSPISFISAHGQI